MVYKRLYRGKNVENSRLFSPNDVIFQIARRRVRICTPLNRCVPIAVADVSRWGFENAFFDLHMWRSTFGKLKNHRFQCRNMCAVLVKIRYGSGTLFFVLFFSNARRWPREKDYWNTYIKYANLLSFDWKYRLSICTQIYLTTSSCTYITILKGERTIIWNYTIYRSMLYVIFAKNQTTPFLLETEFRSF